MSNLDEITVIRLIVLLETTKKQTPKHPIDPKVLESGSKDCDTWDMETDKVN